MKIIFGIFIFCIVLFVYLHVHFHLKTSDDLEMYEVEQVSKDKLEEVCDIRQPTLFDIDVENIIQTSSRNFILSNYPAFEVKIRNVNETNIHSEMFMPLVLNAAVKLLNEDKSSSYYTENNSDFLQETGIIKSFKGNDDFLRPYMVSNCNYDIMMGSNGCKTPLRYEVNYRNFFVLTQGSAQIKLATPKSAKYLHTNYDYENFEFRSPINPWVPQPKYISDFNKIKFLEFTLTPGKTLFIPAFWWYSIQFNEEASISCFRYRTYMNNIAIVPYIGLHSLQIQNVKRNTTKKISINEINYKNLNVDTTSIEELERTIKLKQKQDQTQEQKQKQEKDQEQEQPATTEIVIQQDPSVLFAGSVIDINSNDIKGAISDI